MDKWNLLKKLFAEQIQEKRNDQKNLLDERERLSSKIREIELLIEGLEEELERPWFRVLITFHVIDVW